MCRTTSTNFWWFVTASTLSALLAIFLTVVLIRYCCIKEVKEEVLSQAQLLETREMPGEEHVDGAQRETPPVVPWDGTDQAGIQSHVLFFRRRTGSLVADAT
jgi:hypothetical protein